MQFRSTFSDGGVATLAEMKFSPQPMSGAAVSHGRNSAKSALRCYPRNSPSRHSCQRFLSWGRTCSKCDLSWHAEKKRPKLPNGLNLWDRSLENRNPQKPPTLALPCHCRVRRQWHLLKARFSLEIRNLSEGESVNHDVTQNLEAVVTGAPSGLATNAGSVCEILLAKGSSAIGCLTVGFGGSCPSLISVASYHGVPWSQITRKCEN